ncbi:hypothetical protein [Paenarthrobacter nitroguajacolicus]
MNPYWELDHLQGVYLEDSWILSITATPGRLELVLDIVLRENHPDYTNPKTGEQYCYKKGSLVFEAVTQLHWTGWGDIKATTDRHGETDYGSLDVIAFNDNVWSMNGDFGQINLTSDLPQIIWPTSTPTKDIDDDEPAKEPK